jgi:hypothetical protein
VQVKGTWAPPIGAAIGLVIATLAGLVSLRTGVTGVVIVHDQVVGMAYLVAGVIAWRRRPDNATGPLLVAIGYSWYIPIFQAAPVPLVAGLAFRDASTDQCVVVVPAARLPIGAPRSQATSHRMGLVIAVTAIQMPPRLLLMDRIPAVLQHADRGVTVGCDCVNPFAVASAPGLLARIESLTGFLTVATAVIIMGLVILRLTGQPHRCVASSGRFSWARSSLWASSHSMSSRACWHERAVRGCVELVAPLARAAVPIGFLVGLLRMRMGKAAVADLVVGSMANERRPRSSIRSPIPFTTPR